MFEIRKWERDCEGGVSIGVEEFHGFSVVARVFEDDLGHSMGVVELMDEYRVVLLQRKGIDRTDQLLKENLLLEANRIVEALKVHGGLPVRGIPNMSPWQQLVSDAADAFDLFSPDELEAFANSQREKGFDELSFDEFKTKEPNPSRLPR